jgi:heterodisulfide reductase subunit B
VNKKFKTNFKMPILFFTQLIGIAFDLDEKSLGLKKSVIPMDRVLAKIGQGGA